MRNIVRINYILLRHLTILLRSLIDHYVKIIGNLDAFMKFNCSFWHTGAQMIQFHNGGQMDNNLLNVLNYVLFTIICAVKLNSILHLI